MSENMFKEAWNYAIEELRKEYKARDRESEFIFNFNMNYENDDGETITVSVANPFLQQMMFKKGSFEIVQTKIKEITTLENIKIKCIINPEAANKNSEIKQEGKEIPEETNSVESEKEEISNSKAFKKHPMLQEEFTFETFISGENNNYAYNAAIAAAKNPGKKYSPLLLYGGSGLGKTHLMQAIGNYINNNNPEKLKICYVSAETFTNDFINSTRENKTAAFKAKYRNLDVLLLDDIHFLQNKDATQEELFYTFNALSDKKAQMVFTCDRSIKEIKNMTERLISRISKGYTIDMKPPKYETRVAILQKKIEQSENTLSPEIIDYIAKNVETNVRELEAALNKVIGFEELIGKKPTLEEVKNLLRDLLTSNSIENISLDIIQKVIAENYGISVSDLKSKKRSQKFVTPRQIAIYIAKELTEITYTELGEEFGGRDHTTTMYAYDKICEQIKFDSSLEAKIQLFIREIKDYKK